MAKSCGALDVCHDAHRDSHAEVKFADSSLLSESIFFVTNVKPCIEDIDIQANWSSFKRCCS